uniref:Chemosensory protein n=1 Tax=Semiothisa cinerearia TaxID=2249628 RepID=A0A889XL35_9NEOP|nr:chemosensory protein [Semiothisa cinerearia]
MKAIVCVCLFAVVAVTVARPNEDKYTTKYDNVDVDEILKNDRLFKPYSDCILDVGKCAPDAKELKSHVKEALENNCGKCNEKQKEAVRKVIKYLINEKEEVWKKLVEKYDPDHKYSQKYVDELKELKQA